MALGGGAPEAGEYLPADGVVPVAERRTSHRVVGRPRAAAQHLVLVSEEDLGVLAVRERTEPGPRAERRRRPLPDLADTVERAGAMRRLPLDLGRQALARPARIRVGLVPAHVLHRFV